MTVTLVLNNIKLNFLMFFYQLKQRSDYIYTDIYCKLSKCIGQTPCSYEHNLVVKIITTKVGNSQLHAVPMRTATASATIPLPSEQT